MTDAAEYLVEIDAYTGAGVVTLRYSMSGYRTGPSDTPANTLYDAVVKDPGSFKRSLFSNGRTMGLGEISYGEIVLVNASGVLDALLGYGFDGRTLVVKRLANARAAFSTATTVLRGTVERIDSNAAMTEMRFRLYDRRTELDRPVQTTRYGGTTTSGGIADHLADGTADMKDQPKPLVVGRTVNVSPAVVNPFDLIYQVSDSAVTSIAAYDGQAPLTLDADYATVALLQAATIAPGKYGTCLTSGLLRLGTAAWFKLTCDVVEGATLALRCAGAVTQRILAKMGLTGGTNIDAASFAALNIAAAQELGIYLDDDRHGNDAIAEVLSSVGAYILPMVTGPFQVGLAPVIGSSTWDLTENNIVGIDDIEIIANPDTDKGLPAYRVILRYGRSWTVQTGEAICPGSAAARVGYARHATRETRVENAAVQTTYLLAPELKINTLLTDVTEAATETTRRFNLYSVLRTVVTLKVAHGDADAMTLGSTGTVTLDRFGWDAGKLFTIIERDDDLAAEAATLTLWG